MLSQKAKDIVNATLPVVKPNSVAITSVFYPLMFERYPEVKAYFNEAHQLEGSQRKALANAVIAYAENLDRLEALGDAVSLIVQKHASLNILPEHYPIVGECLLAAIREVLGEPATDEVIAAWGEAYQQLADILIAAEESVYKQHETLPGGWRGEREFVLVRKQVESDVITSFYFEPVDGGELAVFEPGQYTAITLTIADKTVRRNYSLSNSPGEDFYRLSVKREVDGLVSNYLHDDLIVGDIVKLTQPCGDFTLSSSQKPLVLLTGGVGITPTISMLLPALQTGRDVHFIHAAINSRHHAFKSWLEYLASEFTNLKLTTIYSEPLAKDNCDLTGFIDQQKLDQLLPEARDLDLYFLGPKPFMKLVYNAAPDLGIPAEQTHFEFFGPLEDLSEEELVAEV
ncbi:NO-inducible flavohemoprotein [Maricurvus nonylphenolicus]|uniref:NO-inducible flavohemoprotein n=1 Tax=Maricurvus nonylphenolicus TaxID=1008307 RepID=UPI0036F1D514